VGETEMLSPEWRLSLYQFHGKIFFSWESGFRKKEGYGNLAMGDPSPVPYRDISLGIFSETSSDCKF
jgi:hypothetical protein